MLGQYDRSWSTRGFAPDEQFGAWRQMAAEAFSPIRFSAQPASDGAADVTQGFDAACQARNVGDLAVFWLRCAPHRLTRGQRLIDQAPSGVYVLNLPTVGVGSSDQAGRVTWAGPSELVCMDADRPFALEFTEAFEQIGVMIPHARLDPLLADPGRVRGVPVASGEGVGSVAAGVLRALADNPSPLDPRSARGVSDHLLGLVALAVSAGAEAAASESGVRRGAMPFQLVLDEIDRSLSDPDLTPGLLAARIPISLSYLNKLFAVRGTSVGRFILGRRLDRAFDLLGEVDDRTPTSVTQVAMACGFHDSAHFARTFRARFAMTPTQRRLGGGDSPGADAGG